MKVLVFGSTGGIGRQVVKYALKNGVDVVAYVRNPTKMGFTSSRLTIIKGDITNYEEIKRAMRGCDVVINCLGISLKPFDKDYPAVAANILIIKAMKEGDVKRYITWATPSVKARGDKKSYITLIPSVMAGLFLPNAKRALVSIAQEIEKSGLDWTIVRFMAPNNKPSIGKVKVSFGREKLSFNISRSDIAKFMVDQIDSSKYIHKMPIIGS